MRVLVKGLLTGRKLIHFCKCAITKIKECICVHCTKCASHVPHGYCRGVLFFGLEHDKVKKHS
jgi:hypothetical protein